VAVEIERKFLLRDDGWRASVERSLRIRQGYLGGDGCSVRVRISDGAATLNIKSKQVGVSRSEFEYAIPLADGEALLALAGTAVLAKTRHHVRCGAHLWEIDEFEGDNAGLVVAEIELGAEDETFARPDWLGEEVSFDRRYYNVSLVREPYARWRETA
jgi:adenylate cyclase